MESNAHDREQAAVVARILATPAFVEAPLRKSLLEYLFKHRAVSVSGQQIARDVFKIPDKDFAYDAGRVRERCLDLRGALLEYNKKNGGERWWCELPKGVRGEGYRLLFTKTRSATGLFWEAHRVSGRDIAVICDPLLFFHDIARNKLIRYVDTNIDEASRIKGIAELKRLHPDDYHDDLIPGHLYVEVGAIKAAESIREYFWRAAQLRVPLILSKETTGTQLLESSPVLVGTVRTNALTRQLFSSEDTHGLAYRLHDEQFGAVTIDKPKSSEIQSLEKLGLTIDASGNGFLPRPALQSPLGIVSRIANPGGPGAITFIASDAAAPLMKMAEALCDEEQLKQILAKMGWALDNSLPDVFEMLFSVRLWPGNLDEKAGPAQLLSWRV